MPRIKFEDLVEIYRNTRFANGGAADDESNLTVASQAIVDLLAHIDRDEETAAEAGIALLDDVDQVAVGATVKVRVDAPRIGLGILARNVDGLLNGISARIKEPKSFYVVDPAYAPGDLNVPNLIVRYRKVLELVDLFSKAASFMDATRAELIFVKDGKVVLPIRYEAADLTTLDVAAADRLLGQFADDLHRDQKCSILFETLVELCRVHQFDGRFKFVLGNLAEIEDKVVSGYKLFASSFSYSKIKSEFEGARIDYTQKIHKTIVDIQNQLLGIPVATIVVASQMKAPTVCGPESWINLAVLVGAWIFVLMLVVAIINQWLTLNVIKDEIGQKKKNLLRDFEPISGDFVGTFDQLNKRIWWHHAGLATVMSVGLIGGGLATYFERRIDELPPLPCATTPKGNQVASPSPLPPTPISSSTPIAVPTAPTGAPKALPPAKPTPTATGSDKGR